MGQLTTHVLDTANGRTGAGMKVELFRADDGNELLVSCRTNSDGRCDQPLLGGTDFVAGKYRLVFHTGTYFTELGTQLDDPPFLDKIVISFGIAIASQNYHVPLLVSPWAYSTYRGS